MTLPAVRRLSKLLGTQTSHETLSAGAHVYVNFLSLTRRSGWLQGHISKQSSIDAAKAVEARKALMAAATRHLAFTELRANDPKAVPTRDISVVWSADLLRPQLGKILAHEEAEESATAWMHHQQHRLLQSGALFERATGKQWNITGALTSAAFYGAVGGVVTDIQSAPVSAWPTEPPRIFSKTSTAPSQRLPSAASTPTAPGSSASRSVSPLSMIGSESERPAPLHLDPPLSHTRTSSLLLNLPWHTRTRGTPLAQVRQDRSYLGAHLPGRLPPPARANAYGLSHPPLKPWRSRSLPRPILRTVLRVRCGGGASTIGQRASRRRRLASLVCGPHPRAGPEYRQ